MGDHRQCRFLSFNIYFKRNLLSFSDVNIFICDAGCKWCNLHSWAFSLVKEEEEVCNLCVDITAIQSHRKGQGRVAVGKSWVSPAKLKKSVSSQIQRAGSLVCWGDVAKTLCQNVQQLILTKYIIWLSCPKEISEVSMSFHVIVLKAGHCRRSHGCESWFKITGRLPPSMQKFTVPFCSHEDKKWAELCFPVVPRLFSVKP